MSDVRDRVAATENAGRATRPSSGERGHAAAEVGAADKPRSLAADAWRDLRRNPIFWIAAVLVVADRC